MFYEKIKEKRILILITLIIFMLLGILYSTFFISFDEEINQMYNNMKLQETEMVHITKIYNINKVLITTLFALTGIILGVILAIILIKKEENKKTTIKLEKEQNINILGKIPLKFKKFTSELYINNKQSSMKKAYEDLKINMQFLNVNNKGKYIIYITSNKNEEGKSFVAANIATCYAKSGKKVILIDADMQHGKQSTIFNIPNNLGLSNYLSNLDTNGIELNLLISKFIRETTIKNLNVITSGTVPPNPAELLNLPKLKQGIKDLSVFYDIVIIDGTPITESANSLILAKIVNSCIIVVDPKRTRKEELYNIAKRIKNVGGKVLGIVINKAKPKRKINLKFKFRKIKIKKINKRDIKRKIKKIKSKIINLKNIFTSHNKSNEIKLLSEKNIKHEDYEIKVIRKDAKDIKNKNNLENINNLENVNKSENLNNLKNEPNQENEKQETISKEKPKNKFDKIISKNISKITNKIEQKKNDILENIKKNNFKNESNEIAEENPNEVNTQTNNENEDNIKENIENANEDYTKINNENINKDYQNSANLEYENQESNLDDEDSVLVIVDAENGYCRVFSKICFIEKKIKPLEKQGLIKSFYKSSILKEKLVDLRCKYTLTDQQAQRIDTLIYLSLEKYDYTIEKEKFVQSNKAEEYVQCVINESEKLADEDENEYAIRCQRMRINQLAKSKIEIEYKTDNMWKNNKISMYDKIMISKNAKEFEIKNIFKTEQEILRSNHHKNTYQEVVKARDIVVRKNNSAKMEMLEKQKEEIRLENEKIEKERNELKEKQRLQREKVKIERNEKRKQRKLEKLEEKNRKKKEKFERDQNNKMLREQERERQREEARIEEELLTDNLYPKTKNNKNI